MKWFQAEFYEYGGDIKTTEAGLPFGGLGTKDATGMHDATSHSGATMILVGAAGVGVLQHLCCSEADVPFHLWQPVQRGANPSLYHTSLICSRPPLFLLLPATPKPSQMQIQVQVQVQVHPGTELRF